MKKAKFLAAAALVLAAVLFRHALPAAAGGIWDEMTDQEFVRYIMVTPPSVELMSNEDFLERYRAYLKIKLDDTYPWADATDEELLFIRRNNKADYAKAGEAFRARWDRYNRENGVYEQWAKNHADSLNDLLQYKEHLMWENSKLKGDANSHGILDSATVSMSDVYVRREPIDYPPYSMKIDGIMVGTGTDSGVELDKPSGVTEIILDAVSWLVFFLAEGINKMLSSGGIALDNVIFGRVAGYGVKLGWNSSPVSLFTFEFAKGNPYGYVAAVLFQRLRQYIYAMMSIFCLFRLVRIAAKNDFEKMKMEFSAFAENAILAFMLIVLMPYLLEIYLFVRDMLLKTVTFQTVQDMFGESGFLDSFRENAVSSGKELIPCVIYFGAVVLSIFVAGIYIAYAMAMMVHFVLFPLVCFRGIGNSRVYGEWVMETVGLTIMPVIDGMILLIPLEFSRMAQGNLAFSLLALVSCAMLLVARKQARRTLGIRDTGLDLGAMATVMGLAHMAKGVAGTAKRTAGRISDAAHGFTEASDDAKVGKYYQKQSDAGIEGGEQPSEPKDAAPRNTLDPMAEQFATVGNLDDPAFRGKLSNAKMAELYKKRARQKRMMAGKDMAGAFMSGAGGISGGVIGAASGAFLGSGMQAFMAGSGMEFGSATAGVLTDAAYHAGSLGVRGAVGIARGGAALWGRFGYGKGSTELIERVKGEVVLDEIVPYRRGDQDGGFMIEGPGEPVLPGGPSSGGAYIGTDVNIRLGQMKEFLTKDGGAAGQSMLRHMSVSVEGVENGIGKDPAYSGVFSDAKRKAGQIVKAAYDSKRKYNGRSIPSEAEARAELDALAASVRNAKTQAVRTAYMASLSSDEKLGFSDEAQAHRDAADAVFAKAERDVMRGSERLLSEEFDRRELGLDWQKYRKMIRAGFADRNKP